MSPPSSFSDTAPSDSIANNLTHHEELQMNRGIKETACRSKLLRFPLIPKKIAKHRQTANGTMLKDKVKLQ